MNLANSTMKKNSVPIAENLVPLVAVSEQPRIPGVPGARTSVSKHSSTDVWVTDCISQVSGHLESSRIRFQSGLYTL